MRRPSRGDTKRQKQKGGARVLFGLASRYGSIPGRKSAWFGRRRLAAWSALFVLVLDILAGTALPMARAAWADSPISAADWVICSASGGAAPIGDDDDAGAKARQSILCALCLPLAQACLPDTVGQAGPGRRLAMVLRPLVAPQPHGVHFRAVFDARAPPSLPV